MSNYSPMPGTILTLSETLKFLIAKGYTAEFKLKADRIDCSNGNLRISPSDFHIDQYFRFEGNTDPGDGAIVYAISSEKYGLKGVLVNAYGIYADPLTDEMVAKLTT